MSCKKLTWLWIQKRQFLDVRDCNADQINSTCMYLSSFRFRKVFSGIDFKLFLERSMAPSVVRFRKASSSIALKWFPERFSIAVLDGKSRGTCLIPVHVTMIRVWPKDAQEHFPGWTSFRQHKPNATNQPTKTNFVSLPICWEKAWMYCLNYVQVQAIHLMHFVLLQ